MKQNIRNNIMKKLAKTIINEMINSNMLDFDMELEIVRGIIESTRNEEIAMGVEVDYDVKELVSEYRKQYIQMT